MNNEGLLMLDYSNNIISWKRIIYVDGVSNGGGKNLILLDLISFD